MLREISEEMRVALKDRLRDVRHVIRQHRHDGGCSPVARLGERLRLPHAPAPMRGVEDLLGHAVSAFDDAMSIAEKLVPVERPAAAAGGAARSFEVYFRDPDGARAFRRDLYYLSQTVLAKRGVPGARIHEAELSAAHAAMRERRSGLIAQLSQPQGRPQRVSTASALCAALLGELLERRPIRFDGGAQRPQPVQTLEILCLTPVVLACGFATVEAGAQEEPDLIDLTILAAEARLDRIVPACRGADAREELERIFAMLLAHLP